MKRYDTVNQKANIEYTFLTERYEELKTKMENFDRDGKSFYELLATIEVERDDAVHASFTTISENFKEIFRVLEPRGKAFLKWQYNEDVDDLGTEIDDVVFSTNGTLITDVIHIRFVFS